MVRRPSCGQIESNIFSVHMTGRQLLPRCASPRRLLSPGPGPAAARCDSFVSFEKLSVNDFHGWAAPDYQNIYLNCHNILKHSPIERNQLWSLMMKSNSSSIADTGNVHNSVCIAAKMLDNI